MPRTNTAAELAELRAELAAMRAELAARPIRSAPSAVSVEERRTHWRNKAERLAGDGFACECGRNDLRTPIGPGSSHNDPTGRLHIVRG